MTPIAYQEPSAVPVLLFTGPCGVGKTTVALEAARLLDEAGIPHAMADLAVIGACSPRPADDPWNERLVHANLACMWENFRRAGASRLVLCRVLEHRGLLDDITQAVPGAQITVIRLVAELREVQARIRSRESGRDPQWYLDIAEYLVGALDSAAIEDHVVSNQNRPAVAAAREAMRLAGWPATER